jgi:hypothetical protein
MKRFSGLGLVLAAAIAISGAAQAEPNENVVMVKTSTSHHVSHPRARTSHRKAPKAHKLRNCRTSSCEHKHPTGIY